MPSTRLQEGSELFAKYLDVMVEAERANKCSAVKLRTESP